MAPASPPFPAVLLKTTVSWPFVFVTDGAALAPYGSLEKMKLHPRCYGAFPLVFRKYVREEQLLTLQNAIRKVTALPAQRLGLKDRGLLREGMWADVVVFDPMQIRDEATLQEPNQYPEGITYVLVNGQIVITEGEHTGALPGKVLRSQEA